MPKGEPAASIAALPSLTRLSIVDTDRIVPAEYPHLHALTWHRKVCGVPTALPRVAWTVSRGLRAHVLW